MTVLLYVVLGMLLALLALAMWLHRVRADHDAKIAEHWQRNGRDWGGKGW